MLVVVGAVDGVAHQIGAPHIVGAFDHHDQAKHGSSESSSSEMAVTHCGPSAACSAYLPSETGLLLPLKSVILVTAPSSVLPPQTYPQGLYRPPRSA